MIGNTIDFNTACYAIGLLFKEGIRTAKQGKRIPNLFKVMDSLVDDYIAGEEA